MASSSGSASPRPRPGQASPPIPPPPPAVGLACSLQPCTQAGGPGPLPATTPGSPRAGSPAPRGSSRVGPHQKAQRERNVFAQTGSSLCPSQTGPRGRVRAPGPDHIRGNAKALGLPAAPRGRHRSPGIPGVAGAPEPPGSRITRELAPGAGGGEGPRGSGQGGSPSPSAGQTTDLLGRSRWDLPMLAGEAGRGPEAGAAVLEIILEAAGSETPRHLSGVPQLP